MRGICGDYGCHIPIITNLDKDGNVKDEVWIHMINLNPIEIEEAVEESRRWKTKTL